MRVYPCVICSEPAYASCDGDWWCQVHFDHYILELRDKIRGIKHVWPKEEYL